MEIEIRRAEASDAREVKEIYEHPNAYTNTLQLPHPSLDSWEKRISDVSDNVYWYVAVLDGEIVGNIGLEVCDIPRRGHVGSLFGMGVKDDFSGLGIGSKLLSTLIDLADNWLNLSRLELAVYADNDAAVGLYKKFGFVIEGESPSYAFRNGEFVSVYHMGRLKSEVIAPGQTATA